MIPVTPPSSSVQAAPPASSGIPDTTPPSQPDIAATSPIPVVHPRASRQPVLNLSLDLHAVHSPQATADAPGSPTQSSAVRSGINEKRNTPKKSSRKRSTASVDDRASVDARSSKHRRTSTAQTSPSAGSKDGISTPPGSPRMVKSPRAFADLRAVAGLPPRRPETASPPTSPRSGLMDDRPDTGSPRTAKQLLPVVQARTTSWVQPVFKERASPSARGSLTLSPRRGSVPVSSTALTQAVEPYPMPRTDGIPGVLAGSITTAAQTLIVHPAHRDDAFRFLDVDVDGPESDSKTTTLLFDTDGTVALDGSTPVTFIMISAELSVARNALQGAANAYLSQSGSDAAPASGSTSASSNQQPDEKGQLAERALAHASVENALVTLDAQLMFADFTFGLNDTAHASTALQEMRSAAVACRDLLNAPGNTPNASLASLKACLDTLESACITGLEYLKDDKSMEAEPDLTNTENTATTSSDEPARLQFSLSTAELMDDLSSLMDQEIVVPVPAVPQPEKKANQ